MNQPTDEILNVCPGINIGKSRGGACDPSTTSVAAQYAVHRTLLKIYMDSYSQSTQNELLQVLYTHSLRCWNTLQVLFIRIPEFTFESKLLVLFCQYECTILSKNFPFSVFGSINRKLRNSVLICRKSNEHYSSEDEVRWREDVSELPLIFSRKDNSNLKTQTPSRIIRKGLAPWRSNRATSTKTRRKRKTSTKTRGISTWRSPGLRQRSKKSRWMAEFPWAASVLCRKIPKRRRVLPLGRGRNCAISILVGILLVQFLHEFGL